MSAFFDTNILVYAQEAGKKGDRSRALLAEGGKLSVQVLNEFALVSFRKLGRNWEEIGEAVADILALVDPPAPLTVDHHTDARALAADHGLSYYDALIVAAAQSEGCTVLWSEDMQDGRELGALRVVNPF